MVTSAARSRAKPNYSSYYYYHYSYYYYYYCHIGGEEQCEAVGPSAPRRRHVRGLAPVELAHGARLDPARLYPSVSPSPSRFASRCRARCIGVGVVGGGVGGGGSGVT